MESHIGVSVTILTSNYDSPNGSPTREIAKILLVRILCIELVGWNKLVIKLGAGDRNDFTGYFKCDNKKDFLPLLKAAFVNPETK